jgi:CheY-like chemotaxis protein
MNLSKAPMPPLVLVVEDEPLMRMTAVDGLEEAGFRVREAMNADEALKILEAHSDEVQVLFTDVHMPSSMDGMALAEEVHRRWPHIRPLISSGRAQPGPDEIPDHGRFLPKPYYGATLVHNISGMIETQRGSWREACYLIEVVRRARIQPAGEHARWLHEPQQHT